jgi:predicted DNA-binding transcriptional regulator AlpA
MQVKPRLWSAQDVSEYLGVPVQTLYDWRCKGYGPKGKRVGKYLRYDPAEVQRWFDELSDAA